MNPSLRGSIGGAVYVYDMFYIWGFTSAFLGYWALSYVWPATGTLIDQTVYGDEEIVAGIEDAGSERGDEKGGVKSDDYSV